MYIFEELDGSQLAGTFAGDKLKKFYPHQQLQLDYASNLNYEEILTLDNFFLDDNNSDYFDVSDNWSAICQISSPS